MRLRADAVNAWLKAATRQSENAKSAAHVVLLDTGPFARAGLTNRYGRTLCGI